MLSFMAMGFFRSSPMLAYPLLALVLFLSVFCVITLRTLWTRAAHYERIARLPIEDAHSRREAAHE